MPESEEEVLKPEETVEVELEKKPEEKKAEEPLPDWKSLQRTLAYQTRKFEEGMRKMSEIAQDLHATTTLPQVESTDPFDQEVQQVAQTNWQKAIDMRAEKIADKRFEEKMKSYMAQQAEFQRQQQVHAQLEDSKKVLLEKFPSSFDETSEESTLFREVLNEDQNLVTNPRAYEIIASRMERKMLGQGKTPPPLRTLIDKEAERRARVGAGSMTAGRGGKDNGRVTLTREQELVAKSANIPLEQYAKVVRQLETENKVEVD